MTSLFGYVKNLVCLPFHHRCAFCQEYGGHILNLTHLF